MNKNNKIAASIHLTKIELCQSYTCFRHSSINKLYKLLTQAGYDIKYKIIEMINKFYHYYQIRNKASWHFKFILKNDIDFNYKIIIDIIYLDKKLVFYAINTATTFEVNQSINSMLAKNIWEALCQY